MKNKFIKLTGSLVGTSMVLISAATAGTVVDTATYTPGLVIPDNDPNGVADTHNFVSSIQSISDVTVNLNISGSYDGDLYAYLAHGATGFAVLLNRVGVTASDSFGSFDTGFSVTLSDSAASDIHNAPADGSTLSGAWQPDGRNVDPLTSLDTTARTALLDSFNGSDASGDWTLFIADVSPVGIGTLDSWSLTVTGDDGINTIPDASNTFALLLVGGGLLFAANRRQQSVKAGFRPQ